MGAYTRESGTGKILISRRLGPPARKCCDSNSATGGWVEDKDFNQDVPGTNKLQYQAIAGLETAHFDHDRNGNAITPVDVLMAGFYNDNAGGLDVAQKTVTTGTTGGGGTWTTNDLVPVPQPNGPGQARSFVGYTDSVTGEEMAFAGSDSYGLYSGGFRLVHGNGLVGRECRGRKRGDRAGRLQSRL